jgi:hypothetical protein
MPPAPRSSRRTLLIVLIAVLSTMTLVCLLAIAWYSVGEVANGSSASRDAGIVPSMVPIHTPPGNGEQVMPTPNSITILPGTEGVTVRPTADGLRVIPNRASSAVSDDDDE